MLECHFFLEIASGSPIVVDEEMKYNTNFILRESIYKSDD